MRTLAKSVLGKLILGFLAGLLVVLAPSARAQYETPAHVGPLFAQHELDQMLAPIALYPDSLLSQVLMASTYPQEVAEAAQWSRANPQLHGDAAVRAIAQMDWDPSVKSLTAFPQILLVMDDDPDWTSRLGGAFLAQQAQVMETVQQLRERAYAAGHLVAGGELRVERHGQAIVLEPAHAQMIYVPYYDPAVVYGAWWWPAYPPVHWRPWPGYRVHRGLAWSAGVPISAGFFFAGFDWHRRHARIVHTNSYYYRRPLSAARGASGAHGFRGGSAPAGAWRRDPSQRRGIVHREPTLRSHVERGNPSPPTRRDAGVRADGDPRNVGRDDARATLRGGRGTVIESRPDASGDVDRSRGGASRGIDRPDRRDGPGDRRGGRMGNRSEFRDRVAPAFGHRESAAFIPGARIARPDEAAAPRRYPPSATASPPAMTSNTRPATGGVRRPEASGGPLAARINDARAQSGSPRMAPGHSPHLRAPAR